MRSKLGLGFSRSFFFFFFFASSSASLSFFFLAAVVGVCVQPPQPGSARTKPHSTASMASKEKGPVDNLRTGRSFIHLSAEPTLITPTHRKGRYPSSVKRGAGGGETPRLNSPAEIRDWKKRVNRRAYRCRRMRFLRWSPDRRRRRVSDGSGR